MAGQCTDSAGEVVDALMSEEHAFLQNDDIFGDLFEFGDHVRGNEEAALRALSFHDLPRQGEDFLVEGVARRYVQGCLDLVEEGDGRARCQGNRAGDNGRLACGELSESLAAADRQTEAPGVVSEKPLVPGGTQTGVLDQDSCGDIVEVSAGRGHDRVGEQVVGTGLGGVDGDAPRGGGKQTAEDLHERRLARAVGADQRSDSRFSEGEGDVEQSRHYLTSVGVGDGGQGDHELSLAVVSAP